MKGFILYRGPDNIELTLMLQKAKELSIDLKVVNPRSLSVLLDPKKKKILLNADEIELPDFVIAAFANDPSYANIALLQQFETLGVLCINRASVMESTKDKLLTLQILAKAGIPVPKTMLFTPSATTEIIKQEFEFPLVLKIIGGSKGDGVVLVKDEKELKNILRIAKGGDIREELIIQEMIASSKGRDLRVVISGGKAVACGLRVAGVVGEFRSNYSSGGSISSFDLTTKIKELANKTADAMGIFIGGIDLLFTDDGFVVCEVNSIPGFYIADNPDVWGVDFPSVMLNDILSYMDRK